MESLSVWLLLINAVSFAAYGIDKYKAVKKMWRIPEQTLIALAFAGGAVGAWAGMRVWHHKTQHLKFKILVPLAFVVWVFLIGYWFSNGTL